MSKSIKGWTLILLMAPFLSAPSSADDDAALLKDLTAVIALMGLPCGQVVSAKKEVKGKRSHRDLQGGQTLPGILERRGPGRRRETISSNSNWGLATVSS